MGSQQLSAAELGQYLDVLADCKQLREEDVKKLCERVRGSRCPCPFILAL